MQDIGNRCGVSKWTVSAALRGDPRINSNTAARIRAAAEELRYDPAHGAAARRMALQKHGLQVRNNQVALFFPPFFHQGNDYLLGMFRGILDEVNAFRFGLQLAYNYDPQSDGSTAALPPSFARGEVDGAIICGGNVSAIVTALRQCYGFRTRPVVTLMTEMPACGMVTADYRLGAEAAARHLLELGHRQVLCFTHPAVQSTEDIPFNRLIGVSRAFRECKLDPMAHVHTLPVPRNWIGPESLIEIEHADHAPTSDPASKMLLDYLTTHPAITAIIAFNDPTAVHVWYTLRQAGLRVPDDYSIIGFDDTDQVRDSYGRNLLTTVRVPLVEMGRNAATLLLRRVNEETVEDDQLILPTSLVVRESTAAPRVG